MPTLVCMYVFCILCYIAGVLITGSEDTEDSGKTAELYLPSSATSCSLPTLPDKRYAHSADGGLLCGGWDTGHSCLQWSPDTGSWEAAVTLDVGRKWHVSWTPANSSGTILMGGFDDWKGTALIKPDGSSSGMTTTLVKPDGTQEPSFPLKYDTV